MFDLGTNGTAGRGTKPKVGQGRLPVKKAGCSSGQALPVLACTRDLLRVVRYPEAVVLATMDRCVVSDHTVDVLRRCDWTDLEPTAAASSTEAALRQGQDLRQDQHLPRLAHRPVGAVSHPTAEEPRRSCTPGHVSDSR